jgi:hypothetical protein
MVKYGKYLLAHAVPEVIFKYNSVLPIHHFLIPQSPKWISAVGRQIHRLQAAQKEAEGIHGPRGPQCGDS